MSYSWSCLVDILLYRDGSRADVHVPCPLLEEEETAGQHLGPTPGHLWPPPRLDALVLTLPTCCRLVLSCPPPPVHLSPTSFSSCDYWWWSGIMWLKAYHSVSARWAEQAASHFSQAEMWLCSPAGKLVLWEIEHVIRFAAAGSSEPDFSHWRQYLINVME